MTNNNLPISYEEFKPLVADIKSGNGDFQFIGSGAESSVWRASYRGCDYAVKLANPYSIRGRVRDTFRATEAKISTGIKGLGIVGLEQFQSGSPEDGAAIYQFVDGKELSRMAEEDVTNVTKLQISSLWEAVSEATKAGIEFDYMNEFGNNVLYNAELGFTLIDYWCTDMPVSLADNRMCVARSLGPIGLKLTNAFAFDRYSGVALG